MTTFQHEILKLLLVSLLLNWTPDLDRGKQSNTFPFDGQQLTTNEYCATDWLHEQAMGKDPKFLQKSEQLEEKYFQFQQAANAESSLLTEVTLPVVVHIIHNNGAENISDALVLQGIQHLNDAYSNTGVYDPTTGVDTKIQFCLAKRDPDGNPTTGITRTVSPLTSFTIETEDIAMKNLMRWEPTEYINIWLVAEICSFSIGCGVAGYAYFPSAHGSDNDGIVLEAQWMGSTPGGSAALAHEAGHYLGLYHTFQGGCPNNDCLSDGDRVCDTPPDQSTAGIPCVGSANSCMTDVNAGDPNNPFTIDQDDQFWNYMDYGDWDCYSAFTQGQTERMCFFIEGARSSLLTSPACTDPCLSGIEALFTSTTTTVGAGQSLTFTNTSTNANEYSWEIDGVEFSTTTNATFNFTTLGAFDITLVVGNDDSNCIDSYTLTIEVVCPVVANFTASNLFPALGETVDFTNASTNATTYEWTLDDVPFATTNNASTTFSISGTYTICLEANNIFCTDTECLTVLAFEDTQSCDDTFLKSIGDANEEEVIRTLLPLGDGTILAGGGKGSSGLLLLLDNNANTIWERTFDFTSMNDIIYDLKIDSEGFIIGSGFVSGTNANAFAFRYDETNNAFQWIVNQTTPDAVRYYNIVELPNGNFGAFGQLMGTGGPGLGCDGLYQIMDRNTGNLIDKINYNLGSCETFLHTILHENSIYTTGRYNFAGGGTSRMRAAISKLDLAGNEEWSRLYIVPVDTDARLYSIEALIENDAIFTIAQGDFNGTSATDIDLYLTKTDLDGTMNWTRSYNIPTVGSEQIVNIISLPDGFLISGSFIDAGDRAIFLMKTSKAGNIQWAKKYDTPEDDFVFNLLQQNGFIYFAGSTRESGTAFSDILIAKLTLDGEVLEPCEYISDLAINVSNINNSYDGLHPLTVHDYPYTLANVATNPMDVSMDSVILCSATCIEICDNGIDDDDDGFIDCYDNECICEQEACSTTSLEQNFAMRLAWQSTIDLVSVDATPVVANLNPQLDNIPEIIAPISNALVSQGLSNRLLIFRGDGINNSAPRELIIPGNYDMYPDAKPVVGDVNSDGIPELIISCADRRIRVFSNYNESGTTLMELIAVSSEQVAERDYVAFLADFDGDGISEVYAGNEVYQFDFSGPSVTLSRVLQGSGSAGLLARKNYEFRACSPVAVDILKTEDCNGDPDCDGLELVAGEVIYSIDLTEADGDGFEMKIQRDLNEMQNQAVYFEGYTSVADIDHDGLMDVVVAGRENNVYGIYVWNKDGLVQFFPKPTSSPNTVFGTLPCIANVYDDTESGASEDLPEIIVSYNLGLICYNLNAPNGVWWDLSTTDASGLTGVTVFDFNGDDLREIVYRDENNLRIMYGGSPPFPAGVDNDRNWATVIAGSGTFDEHPVVADVDNDKQAEIIVTSYLTSGINSPAADYRGRLRVFESDPTQGGPWLSSRDIWNQYNYFVVNINDDLSLPIQQQEHHLVFPNATNNPRPLNSFLAQTPILNNNFEAFLPLPDADLTDASAECGADSFQVFLTICNIGDAVLPDNTPVAFYFDDPQNTVATWYATNYLPNPIEVGNCATVNFGFANFGNADFFVVVNDDHSLSPPYDLETDFPVTVISECDYTNNINQFNIEGSFIDLDLGPDIVVCDNGVFPLDAGDGFASYHWQDGSTEKDFTAWESGVYWVEVVGACGDVQRDSVTISVDPITEINLGADTILCSPQTLTFTVSSFNDYQWFPSAGLDCTSCPSVNATIDTSITYIVVASTEQGCISVDTIRITVEPVPEINLGADTILCPSETLTFTVGNFDNYQWFPTAGLDCTNCPTVNAIVDTSITYTVVATTENGCISTDTIHIGIDPFTEINLGADTTLCSSETLTLTVGNFDDYQWFPSVGLDCTNCPSVNATIDTSITYVVVASTEHGCMSTDTIRFEVAETSQTFVDTTICMGENFVYDGVSIPAGEQLIFFYTNAAGCDSIIEVNVMAGLYGASFTQVDTFSCLGTSVFLENQNIPADSIATFHYTNIYGCDSTIAINVIPLDTFVFSETIQICSGDSAFIFDNFETTSGVYNANYIAVNGCDSTATIALTILPPLAIDLTIVPTCIADSTGSVSPTVIGGLTPYIFNWSTNSTEPTLDSLGQGIYALTVTDGLGCMLVEEFEMETVVPIVVPITTKAVTCYGDTDGQLLIDSSYQQFAFGLVDTFFQNNLSFANLAPNDYILYIQDQNGCVFSQDFTIEEPRELTVQLPRDTTILLGCMLEIDAFVNTADSISYLWDPLDGLDCIDCPSIVVQPNYTTVYSVQVNNNAGCEDMDEISVWVDKPRDVYIPNAFSPNGDGINDLFMIYGGKDVEEVVVFRIFDRWGELVFQDENFPTDDAEHAWNGVFRQQAMSSAVFVYYAEVRFIDNVILKYTGDVVIMK